MVAVSTSLSGSRHIVSRLTAQCRLVEMFVHGQMEDGDSCFPSAFFQSCADCKHCPWQARCQSPPWGSRPPPAHMEFHQSLIQDLQVARAPVQAVKLLTFLLCSCFQPMLASISGREVLNIGFTPHLSLQCCSLLV